MPLISGALPRKQLRSRCCAAPVLLDVDEKPKPVVRCEDCGRPCDTVEIVVRPAKTIWAP